MCCKYVIGINGTEDFSAGTWRGGGRREHLRCDREIRDDKIGDIDIGDIEIGNSEIGDFEIGDILRLVIY